MKRVFNLFIVLAMVVLFNSCQSAPDAPKADAKDAKETTAPTATSALGGVNIDTKQSLVTFIGTKPVGQHTGVIPISKGTLNVSNAAITGGQFEMDLSNLQITDLEGEMQQKLTGHLQSDDFFDVAKHPTATFEITDVKPHNPDPKAENETAARATHMVSGNLTMKGVEKNISFPAVLKIEGQSVKGMANFNIDRTQWGLVYGNDQSLGDRFIRPEVNIQLKIVSEGKR